MNTYSVDKKKEVIGHYFIFQLKENDGTRDLQFMDKEWHKKHGKEISVENYDITYGGPLFNNMELDDIFTKFKIERPEDFKGHSLSVSDVIVSVTDDGVRACLVDSYGFSEEPAFFSAWHGREIELAFLVADRLIAIQTCTEGYEWNICDRECRSLDGGVYEDFEPSILEVMNKLIMDNLRAEPAENSSNRTYKITKGKVESESMLTPVSYSALMEHMEEADFDKIYKAKVIEEFREKTNSYFKCVGDMSAAEIEQRVLEHICQVVGNFCPDSLAASIDTAVLVGSRSRGLGREDSDLDVVVEYTGDIKEYQLFNVLNEEPLLIGNVRVDINPIRKEETGTLDEYLPKAEEYLAQKRNTYFRVYWKRKETQGNEIFYAYARAYDETDAMKVAEASLNLEEYEITEITPAKKHQITRQDITLNCMDILYELDADY